MYFFACATFLGDHPDGGSGCEGRCSCATAKVVTATSDAAKNLFNTDEHR
jgi:hypothetical protein